MKLSQTQLAMMYDVPKVGTQTEEIRELRKQVKVLRRQVQQLERDRSKAVAKLNDRQHDRERQQLHFLRNQAHYVWGVAIERELQRRALSLEVWSACVRYALASSEKLLLALDAIPVMAGVIGDFSKEANHVRYLFGRAVETLIAFPPEPLIDGIDIRDILKRQLECEEEKRKSDLGLLNMHEIATRPRHLKHQEKPTHDAVAPAKRDRSVH